MICPDPKWKQVLHTRHYVLAVLLPVLISSLDNDVGVQQRRTLLESLHADADTKSSSGSGFRFETSEANNATTVQVGSTAYLHCPVANLGEKELSWVRKRDWHILSHGSRLFTKDDRFQLVPDPPHDEGSAPPDHLDWALMIKVVNPRDSGTYECQVTSEAGDIISKRVELKVETPEAFILADEEYHIERGSILRLVCIIEKATEPPQYVFWYHNDRMINFDTDRGISVTTTPGRRTHSQLSIAKAVGADSGNYTCAPSNSLPASIQVFVSGSEVKPWTSDAASISQSPLGVVVPFPTLFMLYSALLL